MQISPGDRCPVCAMMVRKHKKFASAIQLEDGATYYFCGTGCMIRTWLHPEVFLAKEKSQLKKPVVRAYFTGEAMGRQGRLLGGRVRYRRSHGAGPGAPQIRGKRGCVSPPAWR